MAKRVKCKTCRYKCLWALPEKVTTKNVDYAKDCVFVAKRSFVCDYTMRTKHRDHEQYCKRYEPADFDEFEDYDARITDLEMKIAEFERRSDDR